ncbi:hypothetical protein [Paenibacillus chitinolyticus]|uniref:hypothetical protein n=1 Tax=Paenibacillus chitinolyticus TaxID=79263 RepID=UPI00295EB4F7|nr:hypothetical protein [Paenibacillus chitinolyticus]
MNNRVFGTIRAARKKRLLAKGAGACGKADFTCFFTEISDLLPCFGTFLLLTVGRKPLSDGKEQVIFIVFWKNNVHESVMINAQLRNQFALTKRFESFIIGLYPRLPFYS